MACVHGARRAAARHDEGSEQAVKPPPRGSALAYCTPAVLRSSQPEAVNACSQPV